MGEVAAIVEPGAHRALGPMLTLRLGRAIPALALLPAEARSLGNALWAVCSGASAERELFLSPMASDHWLVVRAGESAFEFEVGGENCALALASAAALAEVLLAAASRFGASAG